MFEWLKEILLEKAVFERTIRAGFIGSGFFFATPSGQEILLGLGPPWSTLLPIALGVIGAGIAAGEKNSAKKD